MNVSRIDIEKLQTFARNSYDRILWKVKNDCGIHDPEALCNPILIISNRLQDMLDLDGKQTETDVKKNHWSEFNRKPKFGESTVSKSTVREILDMPKDVDLLYRGGEPTVVENTGRKQLPLCQCTLNYTCHFCYGDGD